MSTFTPQHLARETAMPHHGGGQFQPRAASSGGTSPIRSLLRAAGMTTAGGDTERGDIAGDARRGLPLVDLFDTRPGNSRYCAVTSVDHRGRLGDRTPLKIIGWEPGTPVTIRALPDVGLIVVRHSGPDAVTTQGHLRFPADTRHACRIHTGDRVLITAYPADQVIVVYTQLAIDTMATAYHATVLAGARA